MKILNLYAGIGGNRKMWTNCEVTAVEIDENIAKIYKDFFPNDEAKFMADFIMRVVPEELRLQIKEGIKKL